MASVQVQFSPYDALTAALLHLYEEVRSDNARRARRGDKLAYAAAVAAVERVLLPDLLSTVIYLDPGCRVRVIADTAPGQNPDRASTRGRLGTVASIREDSDFEVWLDPLAGAQSSSLVYPRDALQPVIGIEGDVLRDPRFIKPTESQIGTMIATLEATLGPGIVSPEIAVRVLMAASGILNSNPAAGALVGG
ncbi:MULTISPECIES: hypothetical protein [Ralstonia]|uniref:hypothetical protein n=1 Tax=Ralstonia pickettii TaxID=329 RepID=UPI001EE739A9|nr:hypothetical protein [Ralstonia pickettii]MCM3583886.1 hypothetical protein [Ralstonia pickettii]